MSRVDQTISPQPSDFTEPHTKRSLSRLILDRFVSVLTLTAVIIFDVTTSLPNSILGPVGRWPMIALYGLFVLVYVGLQLGFFSGHRVLATFTAIVIGLALVGSNPTAIVVLFFILSALAQEMVEERVAYLWISGFGLLSMLWLSYLEQDILEGILIGLGVLGGYLFMGSAARSRHVAETARKESQQLLHELQAAHTQLQQYAYEAEILAAAEERNRLARELHDTLGHRLTVAAVQLEGAERLIEHDAAKAGQMVATVHRQVIEGLAELRQTVAALRSPLNADLALPAALDLLSQQFSNATGLDVSVSIGPTLQEQLRHLSLSARHVLYRTAQEGLTNIQKHAGATRAHIIVTATPQHVQLTVTDDGKGFEPNEPLRGFGLHGLTERATQLGGSLDITTSEMGGVALTVQVPRDANFPNSTPKDATDNDATDEAPNGSTDASTAEPTLTIPTRSTQ